MFNRFAIALLTIGALGAQAVPAFGDLSLDVSPVRVQVHMQAGNEYTNAVRVLNDGKEPVRLRAYVEDWYLDEIGTPIFRPAGTLDRSSSVWMDVAPSDFLLEPGETKFVRFTVKAPAGMADGGYHGSLLLETLPLNRAERPGMQMFVQGRVAVMTYVTIGNPRRAAEIKSMATVRHDGKNFVRMQIANTGEDFVRLAGDMTVVEGSEAVGDGIPIPDVPVLPGAKRWVEFEISPDRLYANYLAKVTVDIDGVGRLIGTCPLDPAKVQLID